MTNGPSDRRREDDFLEQPAAAYAAPFLESLEGESRGLRERSEALDVLQAALADRYEVEGEIGRGGMATVFLAQDRRHPRRVALKVLSPDVAPSAGTERFTREVETVAALTHPHILPLYDSGVADGLLYYAMPYIEGETLRDRLAREGQLPVATALRIAREVADALAHAHARGVVHRDIKPANVLLTTATGAAADSGGVGHALLADFGIARALSEGHPAALTATGVAVGTPAYMSPEQATGDRDVDGRSDIYSLGCLLYEMLAGEPPFTGPTPQAVIGKRLGGPPPSVRRVRPAVGPALDATLARAMAPVPADRFQTADDLLDALRRVESALDTPEPASRRRARRSAVAAALAVLAASAGAVALWRARPTVDPSASAILILPPAPVTPDSALTRLGRELVITLGANLDGVGGIRTADALAVLANVDPADPAPSLDDARALARHLGARSVVRGTLLRTGDSVRVDVALHPTEGGAPLTTIAVWGPADDITALTERTTWAMLRDIWRREGAPTPSLAAVTTSSIPALRAFLDGERAIVEGRWRDGAAAYERSFTQDTSFLLAYWRYALARDYWALEVDPAIRAKYRSRRDRLPPRDRLLIEAEMADSTSVRYERTKAVTERFPDYWLGWWSLSERLTHDTPLIGTSSPDLRAALERTLALNPRMAPAFQHLFWVGLWERDTVLTARIIRELTVLRYDSTSRREQGFDELDFFRYLDALVRSGGVAPDTMLREPGVRMFTSASMTVDPYGFALGITQYGFPSEQASFSRQVLRRGASPSMITAQHLNVAIAQAARGAWDSALVAIDGFASRFAEPSGPLYQYRVAVVGAWLGALEPGAASARRAHAVEVSAALSPAGRAELAWLDGVLAVVRDDTTALASARRAAAASDSVTGPALARSLAALGYALAGDRARAADSLRSLEGERAEHGWSRYRSDAHPFLTVVNRLAAARWLRERGDLIEAARLLTWAEGIPFPLRTTRQANAMVQGLAYLERARTAEALGWDDRAAGFYRRFLWHYDAPTPLHRHLVDEAREALGRLGQPRDAGPQEGRKGN